MTDNGLDREVAVLREGLRHLLRRARPAMGLDEIDAAITGFEQTVRHEHGERIARDHDEQADEYERLGYLGEDIYRACGRRARDLSPAPEAKS